MKANAVGFIACLALLATATPCVGQVDPTGRIMQSRSSGTPLSSLPPEQDFTIRLERQTPYDMKYLYPQFVTGKVFMKGKLAGGLKVNYHKLYGNVVFINPKGDTMILANNPSIEFLQMPENLFYNHRKEGFLELLSPEEADVWLLKKTQLKILKTENISQNESIFLRQLNPDTINYDYIIYHPRDPSRMLIHLTLDETAEYMLFDRDKDLARVSKNNFLKAFSKYRDQVKEWMDANNIDLDSEKDIIKLYEYCVSLK